jgi:hypothetical protein
MSRTAINGIKVDYVGKNEATISRRGTTEDQLNLPSTVEITKLLNFHLENLFVNK